MESDADDIYKNVNLILERYIKTEVSKVIYRKNKEFTEEAEHNQAEPTFPMLSVALRRIRLNSQSL